MFGKKYMHQLQKDLVYWSLTYILDAVRQSLYSKVRRALQIHSPPVYERNVVFLCYCAAETLLISKGEKIWLYGQAHGG